MTLRKLTLVLAAAALLSAQADVALQRAIRTETLEGDLKGAITQYGELAEGSDRAIAAQALIRMAGCYEKLGTAQAQEIYERVVREFGDQTESVTTAQARLAALRPNVPDAPLFRRVWSGQGVDTEGTVSSDGRYLSYPDWSTGNLALRDLVTGTDRTLTNDGSPQQYAERSVISPDGTRVAFARFDGKDHYELRIADAAGNAAAPSRRLYANQEDEWLAPNDWSPDGKWIAVQISKKDRTSLIGLVSADDGSLRVLKSVDWRGPGRIAFSPDGKFIAYDLPADEDSLHRDVFVLAVDGSQETQAVVHPANDAVLGWSPDGSYLLFSSNRTGSIGLWGIRVSDGKPQGTPSLLKPDIGAVASLGLTAQDALFLGLQVRGPEIHVRSFDFAAGKWLSDPVSPIPEYVFTNREPRWSPDGTQLVYISRRNIQGPPDYRVGILSTGTGVVRELSTGLTYVNRPRWSPDGRFIGVNGSDRKGRRGLFHVDTQTGKSTLIVLAEPDEDIFGSEWSPDGKKIYYRRFAGFDEDSVLIERDLTSGVERPILRAHRFNYPVVSPDGRWIVIRASANSSDSLLLVRVNDGETREVLSGLRGFPYYTWAPDSRSILLHRGGTEILQISVSGGEPRGLDLGIVAGQMSIHPDGKKIAYNTGRNAYEVWALENFLPSQTASR